MNCKISIPIAYSTLTEKNLIKVVKELKRCKADRVFVAVLGGYFAEKEKRDHLFAGFPKTVKCLKDEGFEVGAWILSSYVDGESDIDYKRTADNVERKPWRCHADERLICLAEEYARRFAESGVDLIMYDDDFHHGHYPFFDNKNPIGCSCIHHRNVMKKLYGENVDFDYVMKKYIEHKPSKEKTMFEKTIGYALEEYARRVRSAVDKVNPNVRMGIAFYWPNYGFEGTTAEKLSEILAGKNKPFARAIGAPYWQADTTKNLANVFETERYQNLKLKKANIETMTEGDVFPRPRTSVGSTCLELFHMATLADGSSTGILKYMIDYYADADYETGYIDRHVENMTIYEEIEKYFSNKKACGVKIYNNEKLSLEYDFSCFPSGNAEQYIKSYVFQEGAGKLTKFGIPTTYNCEDLCLAVFGEYGRFVLENELNNGALLDIGAAKILTERGIDVGLEKIGGNFEAFGEYFEEGIWHRNADRNGYYDIIVNEKAKVLSWYVEKLPLFPDQSIEEMNKTPSAYVYENKNGQRFCVYNFMHHRVETYSSYARAEQMKNAVEWISKKKLPARLIGNNPYVYIMCKKDEDSLSVGLWNLCQDKVSTPKVILNKEYKSIHFINCSGALQGNEVVLSTLPTLSFCGFEVK